MVAGPNPAEGSSCLSIKPLALFNSQKTNKNMTNNKPIHDYTQRIKQNRHNIQQLPNS
ncbi:MAG: hypothetical protein LBE76_08300 [Nitrososphaerota archaeon]|nr:hypothetical protein [Nitrososphaerota archaeon]